ncbi:MAG: lysophospholipid acyltransferase family protein [Alphaproteobacteria bacterium]|nr:lysophospholipid acyltransferase family protein [Alphaproteobacteria bacterium]MDE2110419.1 lysophospholipid acyltransferase family protein [Alphaproteobacteria bacterium]
MADARELDTFSYANAEDPRLKRFIIRLIERTTGQPYLRWLYEDYRSNPPTNESFWDSAIRRLELSVTYDEDKLAAWPKSGPLVVVSNHPFGVLDGLTICYLAAKVRSDFLVLANSVLYRADEIKPFMLPIDFAETREALSTNLKSRTQAKAHLMAGGCLMIFPAGGVSTTPTMWHKHAVDADWKTFTARLITQARAPVVPVYFAGQNSRLFQIVSHISMTLRLSLLFKEVHNKIGSEIRVRIGDVVPYDTVASIIDRHAFMQYLRQMTYALGTGVKNPPKPFVRRPKRAPRQPSARIRGAA